MQHSSRRAPVYGIDLLRFLAASAVVFYHLKPRTIRGELTLVGEVMESPVGSGLDYDWAWWGFVGVQVFFVISGVVIGFSAQRATPRAFAVSRLTRLWPAMLVCATIISALNLVFWRAEPVEEAVLYLRSITFWPVGPWVSAQIWTLPIEIVFYAVVCMLLVFRSIGRLEQLAWVLAVLSAAFWSAVMLDKVEAGRFEALLLLRHGCYFALGIALMKIASEGWTAARTLLVVLCVATAWPEISAVVSADFGVDTVHSSAQVPYSVWLGSVALIWLSLATRFHVADHLESRSASLARALRAIGLATYPLYLIHLQPGALIMAEALHAGLEPLAAALAGYGATLILALFIALVLEPRLVRPAKAMAERLFRLVPPRQRRLAF